MSSETVIDGIDYGPLAGLVGTWKGDKGADVSPEPDGDEHNPYYETILFEAGGDVTNAEEQTLSIVSYHEVVTRKSNGEVFHDQIGYWLWDPTTNVVIQTLTIPRAVTLLAGGKPETTDKGLILSVRASAGHPEWGILEQPFMRSKASTRAYEHTLTLSGDTMHYKQITTLDIYGKSGYPHTDENTLTRS